MKTKTNFSVKTLPDLSELEQKQVHDVWKLMQLSPANKRQVGAIIMVDGKPYSSGFNKMFEGIFDNKCEDVYGQTIPFTIHAEENAIFNLLNNDEIANKKEILSKATMLVTYSPCVNCCKLIAQAGIKRIIFIEKHYENFDKVPFSPFEFLEQMNIEFIHLYISTIKDQKYVG